jgi:ribose transport system permease protein
VSSRAGDLRLRLRQNMGLLGSIILFAALYLLYSLAHPKGFTSQVLVQNADEAFSLALLAMAQTLPVLAGGLDLSVGAVMTMVNCLASVLVIGSPLQIVGGVLLCLLAGAAFGLANGIVVVYGRIQPIIATLATAAIALGIALFLRPKPGGKVDEDLSWALTNTLGDFADTYGVFDSGKAAWFQPIAWLPVAAILLVVIIAIVWLPLRRTVTGRTIYAIGSAEGAAFMSGLPIVRAKLVAFTLAGLLAGIGGLFLAIETSSGNADLPQAGAYTLNSIAAVVIGGTSLLGGSGSAVGSVMGALVLRVISFNFRVFDVPPLVQPLVEGLVLLAAVSLAALPVLRVKNMLELFR